MTTAFEQEQEREQAIAKALVAELGKALRALGWDCVVVRVSRVLDNGGGDCAAPGATYCAASPRIIPALPFEADALRGVADTFDATFQKSGVAEATEGYSEDVSHEVGL